MSIRHTVDSWQSDLPIDQPNKLPTNQLTDQDPSFTMTSSGVWCTIEPDLGLFTNIVKPFGVRGSVFAELWSLADNYIHSIFSN